MLKSKTLEKLSVPAASAGSGAFLMAGNYHTRNRVLVKESSTGRGLEARFSMTAREMVTYSGGANTIILLGLLGVGEGLRGSLDEDVCGLRAADAMRLRHGDRSSPQSNPVRNSLCGCGG